MKVYRLYEDCCDYEVTIGMYATLDLAENGKALANPENLQAGKLADLQIDEWELIGSENIHMNCRPGGMQLAALAPAIDKCINYPDCYACNPRPSVMYYSLCLECNGVDGHLEGCSIGHDKAMQRAKDYIDSIDHYTQCLNCHELNGIHMEWCSKPIVTPRPIEREKHDY